MATITLNEAAHQYLLFQAVMPKGYLNYARTQAIAKSKVNSEIEHWLSIQEADANGEGRDNDCEDMDALELKQEVATVIGGMKSEELRAYIIAWSDREADKAIAQECLELTNRIQKAIAIIEPKEDELNSDMRADYQTYVEWIGDEADRVQIAKLTMAARELEALIAYLAEKAIEDGDYMAA